MCFVWGVRKQFLHNDSNDEWVDKAVQSIRQFGFVALPGCLSPYALKEVRETCEECKARMLKFDPKGLVNLEKRRYFFWGRELDPQPFTCRELC